MFSDVSLGSGKANNNNNNPTKAQATEQQIEAQMIESGAEATPEPTPEQTLNSNDQHTAKAKPNGHAAKLTSEAVVSEETVEESKAVRLRHVPRLHAHRATQELEPEEDMDDSYIDPNYGKPKPYRFGQKLSVKMPWKKEKARETGSDPPSCSSSVSSVDGVKGETWTKTGSLPALFRKRSLSLTFYFVIADSFFFFFSKRGLPYIHVQNKYFHFGSGKANEFCKCI